MVTAVRGHLVKNARITYYDWRVLCSSANSSATCRKLAGERYYAAYNNLAFGSKIRVSAGNKSVVCTVLDRGGGVPMGFERWADLSPAAFAELAPLSAGVVRADIEWLGKGDSSRAGLTGGAAGGSGAAGGGGSVAAGATGTKKGTKKGTKDGGDAGRNTLDCSDTISALQEARLARVVPYGQLHNEIDLTEQDLREWNQTLSREGYLAEVWKAELLAIYSEIGNTYIDKCGADPDSAWSITNLQVVAAFNDGTVVDNPSVAIGDFLATQLDVLRALAMAVWFVINPANWAKIGMYLLGAVLLIVALVLAYLFTKRG